MTKSEKNSPSFEAICKDLTNKSSDDTQARKVFAQILMKMLSEHDMSLNEAHQIISGDSHIEFSHSFKMVGLTDTRLLQTMAADPDATALKKNSSIEQGW